MGEIRTALIGVGNCASSLVQGVEYYSKNSTETAGLISPIMAGYTLSDIKFVAAFDIDERKIGKDLSRAIFEKPNCTTIFQPHIDALHCPVAMGYQLDSVAAHTADFEPERRVLAAKSIDATREAAKNRIVSLLQASSAHVLVNFLPVGSEEAAKFYAECAIAARVAFVNAMPVFISKTMAHEFTAAGLPILGDDVKSQVGATIVHRALTKLFADRGQKIHRTYQLNMGGNTDFLGMLDRSRLESKKFSKTNAVTSQLGSPVAANDVHVGPSDYVPWLKDNKVCYIRIEGEQFGGVPMNLELRLSVEDSPNSAGVIVDAIRAAKIALDRKLSGPIIEAAAYLFKTPTKQYSDEEARVMLLKFCKPA